jgi:hypothetical protein
MAKSKEKSHSLGEFTWNVAVVLGALLLLGAGIEAISD